MACFITLEGIDGAGKTSHLPAIAALLAEHGIDALLTREPGGTPLGERLRAILGGSAGNFVEWFDWFVYASFALYFSRAPIPWWRDGRATGSAALPSPAPLRHIGIYSYRADFLRRFPTLPQAPTEAIEALEQLRALYSGYKIHLAEAESYCPPGVDTAEDLQKIIEVFHETA